LRESFPAAVESSHLRRYHHGIASDFRQPNGRFLVRMPVSLHKQASLAAASEGVSLNQ
jgi:predicted HicB family RNase H-like nuclease